MRYTITMATETDPTIIDGRKVRLVKFQQRDGTYPTSAHEVTSETYAACYSTSKTDTRGYIGTFLVGDYPKIHSEIDARQKATAWMLTDPKVVETPDGADVVAESQPVQTCSHCDVPAVTVSIDVEAMEHGEELHPHDERQPMPLCERHAIPTPKRSRMPIGPRGEVTFQAGKDGHGDTRTWRRTINGRHYQLSVVNMPDGDVRLFARVYNGYGDSDVKLFGITQAEADERGMWWGCAWTYLHGITIKASGASDLTPFDRRRRADLAKIIAAQLAAEEAIVKESTQIRTCRICGQVLAMNAVLAGANLCGPCDDGQAKPPFTPAPKPLPLVSSYDVNEAGATSLRDAKPMHFGGRYVTAQTHGDTASVFVGLTLHHDGPMPEGVEAGSPEFYAWVREVATAGEANSPKACETYECTDPATVVVILGEGNARSETSHCDRHGFDLQESPHFMNIWSISPLVTPKSIPAVAKPPFTPEAEAVERWDTRGLAAALKAQSAAAWTPEHCHDVPPVPGCWCALLRPFPAESLPAEPKPTPEVVKTGDYLCETGECSHSATTYLACCGAPVCSKHAADTIEGPCPACGSTMTTVLAVYDARVPQAPKSTPAYVERQAHVTFGVLVEYWDDRAIRAVIGSHATWEDAAHAVEDIKHGGRFEFVHGIIPLYPSLSEF